jgi:alpha-glucosidase (family GH31 glycosyl hydrolase)
MDGMWGRFKVYRQEYGGLEEYIILGRTLKDVVRIYADLVGYPLLVPRWAFGYLAGGMKYSMLDEPRACDALMDFAKKLKQHDIPCSAMQMSSGYTVAETEPKTRNVFTWNRHRFPDPKGFCEAYHKEGIRLMTNIKPYILANHPEYERLKASGAFFTDPNTNESAQARLWSAGGGESGLGGHIDFTSKAGYKFWYEGVKELKRIGIDSMWNDNNEYTLPSDSWQCALDEPNLIQDGQDYGKDVGFWGRALNTELMGKASHDATLEIVPKERPFILTRSGTAGTLRYCASAWSGDNVTSWDGMRGANALSLTAGLCLMQVSSSSALRLSSPLSTTYLLLT